MVDYREPEKTIDYNISESDRFRLDDFELYNLAGELRGKVYIIINQLHLKERFVLENQGRDAFLSVTNNIAKAHGILKNQSNFLKNKLNGIILVINFHPSSQGTRYP